MLVEGDTEGDRCIQALHPVALPADSDHLPASGKQLLCHATPLITDYQHHSLRYRHTINLSPLRPSIHAPPPANHPPPPSPPTLPPTRTPPSGTLTLFISVASGPPSRSPTSHSRSSSWSRNF